MTRSVIVVIATGGYHVPKIPRFAERLAPDVVQLTAREYRNAGALPGGDVLVVGTGQSGCQIAEDLHLEGRRVHLCTGGAQRTARSYRGRDVVAWLHDWRPGAPVLELDPEAAGIASVVWCMGFAPDYGWVQAPVFDGRGRPCHDRGATVVPGLCFLGLPWLYTWGSGRLSGIARDAEHLAELIAAGASRLGERAAAHAGH